MQHPLRAERETSLSKLRELEEAAAVARCWPWRRAEQAA
jgi:hypothetical protein